MPEQKLYLISYRPLLVASPYKMGSDFKPAAYMDTTIIAANSVQEAVKSFHEGNNGEVATCHLLTLQDLTDRSVTK